MIHTESTSQSSLTTQSFIRGLLVLQDFCFGAVWAAGPLLKKNLNYELLSRAVKNLEKLPTSFMDNPIG